jgi:hypothetical protein
LRLERFLAAVVHQRAQPLAQGALANGFSTEL